MMRGMKKAAMPMLAIILQRSGQLIAKVVTCETKWHILECVHAPSAASNHSSFMSLLAEPKPPEPYGEPVKDSVRYEDSQRGSKTYRYPLNVPITLVMMARFMVILRWAPHLRA